MITLESIKLEFERVHGKQPDFIVQAPGRVNLIGEHTDYNDGLVMPAAIDRYIWFAFGLSERAATHITALNLKESVEIPLFSEVHNESNHWSAYLRGAAIILSERGATIPPFQCVFGGDIPIGSGLSSSAALSCGTITGLAKLAGIIFPGREMARMAQDIERRFLGLQCGIMDQMACLFGKKGGAMLLDCLTLEIEAVELSRTRGKWFLIDSGVKHSLAAESAYNERCRETEAGLEAIRKVYSEDIQFRDLNHRHIQAIENDMPIASQRLRFYLEENTRVESFKKLTDEGENPRAIGALLNESHAGLKRKYEATSFETDCLAALLRDAEGVYGARQVGGGFGGAVLVFAEEALSRTQKALLIERYHSKTSETAEFFEFEPSDGCKLLNRDT